MIRLKHLLLEKQTNIFDDPVTGTYKVPVGNCDALHAFEKYGKINTLVNEKLMQIYDVGYNPDIESVDIQINSNTGTVDFKVRFKENTDENAIAYVGFYTRGGGAGPGTASSYPKYLTDTNPNHHTSIAQAKTSDFIKKRGIVDKMVTAYVKEHYPDKGCNIKQFFYKYSLKEYPAHTKIITPFDDKK